MKSQGETTKKVDKIVKVTKDFISPGIALKKLKSISSIDDYDVIVKNKVQNKTYLIDSSLLGGSGIQTIAEGTNITVDATDPLNPIISATDNASALFPNGIEIVSESRAFLSSDSGKMLFLLQDVNITFDNVFVDLSTLGVFCIGNNTVEMENGSVVSAANGEFLHLIYGGDGLAPISSFKYDGKTALRYLYDKVNARIYEAIISQTGTDAPTVVYTVKDDLDGDITFTRTDVGDYRVNSSAGLFFVEKASMQIGYYGTTYRNHISTYYEANDNYSWFLKTYDDTGTLADNAMTPITIKITVYSA